MMDGEIGVEGEHGKGSTFYFTARFKIRQVKAKEKEKLVAPDDLTGLRVLVVDDNETARDVLEAIVLDWHAAITRSVGSPPSVSADRWDSPFGRTLSVIR